MLFVAKIEQRTTVLDQGYLIPFIPRLYLVTNAWHSWILSQVSHKQQRSIFFKVGNMEPAYYGLVAKE